MMTYQHALYILAHRHRYPHATITEALDVADAHRRWCRDEDHEPIPYALTDKGARR